MAVTRSGHLLRPHRPLTGRLSPEEVPLHSRRLATLLRAVALAALAPEPALAQRARDFDRTWREKVLRCERESRPSCTSTFGRHRSLCAHTRVGGPYGTEAPRLPAARRTGVLAATAGSRMSQSNLPENQKSGTMTV